MARTTPARICPVRAETMRDGWSAARRHFTPCWEKGFPLENAADHSSCGLGARQIAEQIPGAVERTALLRILRDADGVGVALAEIINVYMRYNRAGAQLLERQNNITAL